MAGKAVIPIVLGADGRVHAEFMGEERTGTSPEELAKLEAAIRFNGMYPWAAPRADIERVGEDQAERDALTDRLIIEEYQPLLSLHGHIHESRGATTIGRTVCINPGSEYNSGRLLGVLITVTDHEVRSRQFIAG
jgi:hypothetical protein